MLMILTGDSQVPPSWAHPLPTAEGGRSGRSWNSGNVEPWEVTGAIWILWSCPAEPEKGHLGLFPGELWGNKSSFIIRRRCLIPPHGFMEGGQCEEKLSDALSGPEETPKLGQKPRALSEPLTSSQALAGDNKFAALEAEGDGDTGV